jgi:hypothetical protein
VLTEFGEEEGEDEPDGAGPDDDHGQMRRVASAPGEGREGRALEAASAQPGHAPAHGEEAPASAAGDRRHRGPGCAPAVCRRGLWV